jgi:hypothetical protein
MGENRNLARKPERRRHIQRLKCTSENNITTNLKVIGHESVECGGLVRTVTNFPIP